MLIYTFLCFILHLSKIFPQILVKAQLKLNCLNNDFEVVIKAIEKATIGHHADDYINLFFN